MDANLGLAGKYRYVVKRADGSIKSESVYQDNLITNTGLDFFGGDSGGINFLNNCAIGTGNSNPVVTENKLVSYTAKALGVRDSFFSTYIPNESNTYISHVTYRYMFTGLNNVNVSELGVFSTTENELNTRALIKDNLGNPTTITVLNGETLEIFYRLYRVISTSDVNKIVNMDDGAGNFTPYNVMIRPDVGRDFVAGFPSGSLNNTANSVTSSDEPLPLPSPFNTVLEVVNYSTSVRPYVKGTYKKILDVDYSLSETNGSIRHIIVYSEFFPFVARYGSVSNDDPIIKTDKDTLKLSFEYSWGRYEGEL